MAVNPACKLFKPAGIPARSLPEIRLQVDELEALRLADWKGLYHNEAAKRMKVSRQTFGRIVESARKKVAGALIEGKVLRVEGGVIEVMAARRFACDVCHHRWTLPSSAGRPLSCPRCGQPDIRRAAGRRRAACPIGGRSPGQRRQPVSRSG